jgi:hypothetical protein
LKRFWGILLVCVLTFCCTIFPVSAVEAFENSPTMSRASGRLDYSLAANSTIYLGDDFYLEKGEIVSYNCTYTPKSASVDFGFIAPDGLFYSLNSTSGSINKSIEVSQTGQFTLAIRNNESYAVTVTGTVRY